jgi:outer membrane lipoprotein-sorting protein
MRRIGLMKRKVIVGLAIGLFIGIVSVSETPAQGILREILSRMDKHSAALTSLTADLKMVKSDPVTDESDTYEGTIAFLAKTSGHPRYARIDWTKPRESVVVIGDAYQLYSETRKTITTGKTGQGTRGVPGVLGLLSMSKDQLTKNYTVDYVGQEGITGAVQTWHLRLTPKGASIYKSSDIWVDGDGMALQAMDTEKNNNTTTMLLTRVRRNESIKGDIFKIVPAPGTKTIKG